MRKTLIALMFAAALPTVAMAAMPEGPGPMGGPEGHMMGGPGHGDEHGPRGKGGPFSQLDLSKEQRQQIGKLMGEQMQQRREINERYLAKLPAADQKAMKDELQASRDKTDTAVRNLLKPEQQKKFDELQKERAAKKAEWQEFQAWKAEKGTKAQ